ncbi:hypothetical protein R6L23_23315 [Streptomyces sp. SR27]|uniref:hypothetical protein n=1 Tax=unclassified Streptomyces TaxID=2593676 RepID=UPI00295B9386|nr:hypothetical protein [Streptomyces sp. SR27]MDV9191099.1 hypothetical protein [Streptomyces sp. SR27]
MSGLALRWSARAAGAVAGALLVTGGTAGVTFAADTDRTAVAAAYLPTVDMGNTFAVVATTHPDTVGCNGYKVVGSGTSTGKPLTNGGTWTQNEEACTATVPGKWDIKGTATITEPDGDKLNLSYHLSAPLTADTLVYPTGTFTITGGSGNYAFVRGSGKMNARVNLLDHDHVSSTLLGDIEYLG